MGSQEMGLSTWRRRGAPVVAGTVDRFGNDGEGAHASVLLLFGLVTVTATVTAGRHALPRVISRFGRECRGRGHVHPGERCRRPEGKDRPLRRQERRGSPARSWGPFHGRSP